MVTNQAVIKNYMLTNFSMTFSSLFSTLLSDTTPTPTPILTVDNDVDEILSTF